MPAISIVMPVYNVEPWLRECLDSVRAQTFADWECICIDDGSTDASPAILDEYAAKDSRFRVFRREHSNAGAVRNAGMDLARGAFFSFLDSDDVFAPPMLEVLHEAIERTHSDIATCEIVRFQDGSKVPRLDRRTTGVPFFEYHRPAATTDIFSKWAGRAWDKLFRRELIDRENLQFQEIRSTNDARFTYSALALSDSVVSVRALLIAYRVSSGSLQRTRHLSAGCLGEAVQSYASEMERRHLFREFPSLERFFKFWAVHVLFWNMDTIDTPEGYGLAHSVFSRLCEDLGLSEVVGSDNSAWKFDQERLKRICAGCSPMESLLLERTSLRREVEALRPLRGVDLTAAYRIGAAICWLPKRIKRLFRRFRPGFRPRCSSGCPVRRKMLESAPSAEARLKTKSVRRRGLQ